MEKHVFLAKLTLAVDESCRRKSREHVQFWSSIDRESATRHGLIVGHNDLSVESETILDCMYQLAGIRHQDSGHVPNIIRVMSLAEKAWVSYQKNLNVCGFEWEGFCCQRDKGHTGKHYAKKSFESSELVSEHE